MYFEFLVIYIALGILFLMLTAVIVLLVMLMKRGGASSHSAYDRIFDNNTNSATSDVSVNRKYRSAEKSGKVVFCKNCAAEFDAGESECPNCGMPR